ncbi:AAA family ATPase [Bacteroides fragilis]
MWKLKNIEAENLCAFRHLSYTLQQGVTTLIFGDNRDNESQQSNGAGKSALLECIAVGITGSPLRKIRSEEIINDAAEECRIELRLTNDFSGEELSVARRIPRKGASTVACMLWRDGKEAETDEAVQPSVDAYNWYILDKLGITRDELLNNFILSKYRYADFLSSSDKEKKEIINRFSNGILVDEAIARVRRISTRSVTSSSGSTSNWLVSTAASGCCRSRSTVRRQRVRSADAPGRPASQNSKRLSLPNGSRYAYIKKKWRESAQRWRKSGRRTRHCRSWNHRTPHWKSV